MLKKFITAYNNFVIGENKQSELRKRIFVLVVWAALILAFAGNTVNILMDFPPFLIKVTSAVIIIIGLIYFRIRTNKSLNYEKYIYVFWFLIFIIVPTAWFYNAGIDSNTIGLLFVVFVSMFLTVKPEHRKVTFLLFLALTLLLILCDFYFPQLIVRYSNKEQRIVDLIFGYALYFSLLYSLLNLLLKNSDFERNRLNLRNDQLRKLSQVRSELNMKLEKLIQEKDRFISIVAHDLRSPFQGILGVVQVLTEDYDNITETEKKTLIKKLHKQLEKQYKFLDDLLMWGKIQKNAISINYESIEIKNVFRELISLLNESITQKEIKIELQIANDKPVNSDKNLLSMVFRNILSNAIKFSEVNSKIEIDINVTENDCSVSIRDYGIGISKNMIEKMFRVEEDICRNGTIGEAGSGFGLILTKEILEKLNGTISVKSEVGFGTTFLINIPNNYHNLA